MRCLYIQQNLIEKIENLQHCKMLAVLNLESNRIKKLENLDCLEHLETLHIGKNCLSTYDSLVHLINLKKLSGKYLTQSFPNLTSYLTVFGQGITSF